MRDPEAERMRICLLLALLIPDLCLLGELIGLVFINPVSMENQRVTAIYSRFHVDEVHP
jgi:hypothetical protein